MPTEMQQLVEEAERLGKLVAQHPAVARYRQAQQAVAELKQVDARIEGAKENEAALKLARDEVVKRLAVIASLLLTTETLIVEKPAAPEPAANGGGHGHGHSHGPGF